MVNKLRSWWKNTTDRFRKPTVPTLGPLREFVYLDEVSVYSMLASRKGGIATEFTESETDLRHNESANEVSFGVPGTGVRSRLKSQDSHTHGSQIVRRAVIQTSFKELYEMEAAKFAFRLCKRDQIPKVRTVKNLTNSKSLFSDGWLLDPDKISRGDLLQVQVELGTEPFLRMATAITTFCDLAEKNSVIFDRSNGIQLVEGRAIAQLLESLLADLIPIRGRLVEYDSITIHGRDILVHRLLLDQLPNDTPSIPVFVVGVAQQDQFWKDIRQILFSEAQYTVFGRIEKSGLTDSWNPVKALDVFAGIIPDLDDQLQKFNEAARSGMIASGDETSIYRERNNNHEQDENRDLQIVGSYINALAQYHNIEYTQSEFEMWTRGINFGEEWFDSVDGRREVFADVTRSLEKIWCVSTPGNVMYDLRLAALKQISLDSPDPKNSSREDSGDVKEDLETEKFLEIEIVGIYW